MATSKVGPEWTGQASYGAGGHKDVLLIVSEDGLSHPDVVQRRPAVEMTEEVREKLENQGIAREDQCDDLTIIKARYHLDKERTITGVEKSKVGGEILTKESVLKKITILMNNHVDKTRGVILYYIGAGRRNTGDWCFEDGFITFRDLADLYLQLLRGRDMTIITDCSHSGCWVKECMTFLDEQGVGPCGHSAKKKGILINVFTSCLSHQTPRQLAFSVLACMNDKNTGDMTLSKTYNFASINAKIADAQHGMGTNSTWVRCGKDSIDDECLCLPQANWQIWHARKRIYTVTGEDKGRKAWHMLLIVDDDETILQFIEKTQGDNSGKHDINFGDCGIVLKSGWGEGPTGEEVQSVVKKYEVYKERPKKEEH